MSGQNWSIVIAPPVRPGDPASFTPDLMGVNPGDPLQAGNADIISWNNRTSDFHQPLAVGANGQSLAETDAKAQGLWLSDPIPPFQSSRPGYVTNSSPTGAVVTILYTCAFHPEENARILVYNS